jgi:hypothetical protein
MTVGELRALLLQLDSTDVPDDAPVLIQNRYCCVTCRAEVQHIHPINPMGQAQPDVQERGTLKALLLFDTSRS